MSTAHSIITLTSDFGEGSPYVAQLKGAILSINPEATIVDITHSVPPQDVAAGAVALAETCRVFPPQTIHVAVVDPGVGSGRAILCWQLKWGTWIAPDNGLLTRICQIATPSCVRRVTNPEFWRPDVSPTFHGRDIMAPVAAHLSLGVPMEEVGEVATAYQMLAVPTPQVGEREIRASVVMIDSFGNALTNLERNALPQAVAREMLEVGHGDCWTQGVDRIYADGQPGEVIALLGSNEALELAVVDGNAAKQLGIEVGDEVVVRW